MTYLLGKMADNSSARKVEIEPFEPPKENTKTANPLNSKKLSYLGVFFVLVILTPVLFKLFDLLGPPQEVVVVGLVDTDDLETATNEPEQSPEDSPFVDALLAQARLDAQEILSVLLPLRTSLEDKDANIWASEEFLLVQSLGEEGDLLYQERAFDLAVLKYQEALAVAESIDARTGPFAEQLREQGFASLDLLDAETAIEKFQLAQLIEPDNQSGQNGLNRADSLDEVVAITQIANNQFLDSELENAKNSIETALALDSEHGPAVALLVKIDDGILLGNFQQQMSLGYQGLAEGDYDVAESAFRAALALMPENSAAADGLDQLDATREADRGENLMQQARSAENAEQWLEAHQAYRQLLLENPNRVEARVALVSVDARLELDTRINEIIEDPLSLRDESAWRNAEGLLGEARSVRNSGPLLMAQIDQLADTIRKARTPVRLEITSDGQTNVSVLGISELGLIRSHPLDLNPGRYVLIGKKSGFQDVREEVVLTGDEARIEVHILPTRSLGTL